MEQKNFSSSSSSTSIDSSKKEWMAKGAVEVKIICFSRFKLELNWKDPASLRLANGKSDWRKNKANMYMPNEKIFRGLEKNRRFNCPT